jgi:hypothetical protein
MKHEADGGWKENLEVIVFGFDEGLDFLKQMEWKRNLEVSVIESWWIGYVGISIFSILYTVLLPWHNVSFLTLIK